MITNVRGLTWVYVRDLSVTKYNEQGIMAHGR